MFKKKSGRTLPSVYREESFIDNNSDTTSSWYNDFVGNLGRSAQNASSIYDQINSILGNTKSKYSSVEEAVEDLKHRTGLKAMLEAKKVIAQLKEPEAFQNVPEMKFFIDNFIDDHPGTTIESVVHELLRMTQFKKKLPEGTDLDDDVKSYINQKLLEKQKNSDSNNVDMHLGKADVSQEGVSDDPFAICEPLKQR